MDARGRGQGRPWIVTDHNPTAALVTYPLRVGLSPAPVLGQAEKWLGNGQREENTENDDKHGGGNNERSCHGEFE